MTGNQIAEVSQKYLVEAEEAMVPEGYKKNDVGGIPEDWGQKSLGELANIFSGGTPNRGVAEYWGGDIPWITTTLIDNGDIAEANEFITQKGVEGSSAKWCKAGAILMAMYGQGKTRGKVGYLSFDATINQACAAIELKDSSSGKFVFHTLASMYEDIRGLSNSGGQENLSSGIIKHIYIPYPPQKEQTAIANALSDVDALLSELEKLIAKKQAIKTATMQQLLTGRTRLPQFALREDGSPKGYKQSELGEIPEDWDCVFLGEVGQTIIGLTYSPRDVAEHGTLVLRSSNVQNNQLAYENNVFVNMDLPCRVIVKEGDILICVRNGSRQLIGKCALIDKAAAGSAFGAFMSVFRTSSYSFVFYQFQSNVIQNQINEIMGATINQITNKDMSGFQIILPGVQAEQNAIATTLSDMDDEIQALEQRLNKTRQIKQGMMQELLTGKTRLVTPQVRE